MEAYQVVAGHIFDAIRQNNFTIGGIIDYARDSYGDTREMVSLVLGMLIERGLIKVTPTGIDWHDEPLPIAWWSVYLI